MKRYCLDTNVFIEAWTKYYSMKLCPDYWQMLDGLADKGIIYCPFEVRREIEKIEDGLSEWVKARPHFFAEVNDEVQQHLGTILGRFPRLVDSTKQRSIADPWVIAHAMADSSIVVTKEETTNSTRRIKIPDVCRELNVPYMNDFDFLREVGVTFSVRNGGGG